MYVLVRHACMCRSRACTRPSCESMRRLYARVCVGLVCMYRQCLCMRLPCLYEYGASTSSVGLLCICMCRPVCVCAILVCLCTAERGERSEPSEASGFCKNGHSAPEVFNFLTVFGV